MKKTLFKGALLAFSVMFLATTEVSAQGFFKKLKEAAEKVESVTKTANALMGGGPLRRGRPRMDRLRSLTVFPLKSFWQMFLLIQSRR